MFVALEESFEDKEPWRKRRPAEEVRPLKWTNILIWIILLFCFMLTVHRVDDRAQDTLHTFWSNGNFRLKDHLVNALEESEPCTHTQTVSVFQWDAKVTLNRDDRDYVMARTTELIRRAIWVTGAAVFLGALNKLLFLLNIHELRYERMVAPKGYLIALELFAIIWSIAALEQPIQGAKALTKYMDRCAPGREHLWDIDWSTALFVAHALTLTLYGVNWGLWVSKTGLCNCGGAYGGQPYRRGGPVRWPAVRRWWRAVATAVAAPVPDDAVQKSADDVVEAVARDLRVLRWEVEEIAQEYRAAEREREATHDGGRREPS